MQSDGWNFADVWEWVADHFTLATAQLHGGQRTTWGEMDRRADGIAATLLAAGAQRQDKVAHYLYNAGLPRVDVRPLQVGLVPVNTNYRYGDDELVYLWTNCDAVAVIFHASLTERVRRARPGPGCADVALRRRRERVGAPSGRSPTSKPRPRPLDGPSPPGVAAATTSICSTPAGDGHAQGRDVAAGRRHRQPRRHVTQPPPGRAVRGGTRRTAHSSGTTQPPGQPLMHGTGAFNAMWNLTLAGSVVTLESRTFDVIELLDTCEQERVKSMSIVGGAPPGRSCEPWTPNRTGGTSRPSGSSCPRA